MSFLLLLFLSRISFFICVNSYKPVDLFVVNCGSIGKSSTPDLDNRNWVGDIGSTLFSLIDPNNRTVKVEAPVSKAIPYDTARLSYSEFSYSFPVTEGQKFIRLHFCPSSYLNFHRSVSLFSVKAGPHTLLKDFQASLTADYAAKETIMREYCVNVKPGQRLNITFTPSQSYPNAYAFVNGIEVVSMPTYLYYRNPSNLQAMLLNGGTTQFPVPNSSALEIMYRINVGGRQISPLDDTGMFRYWDEDRPYLEIERPRSVSAGFGLKPIYKDDQNYFAPDELYMTARNYGMNETSKFNVTWEFQVDSEFHYMVRLHFCEFDQLIQKTGDRVFQIFISDNLVELVADVFMWSSSLVPVHKDYAVSIQREGSLKHILSIKLQPHPTARSTFRDVLLNGIEILKISDHNDNLGSPNPYSHPSLSLPPPSKTYKDSKKTRVILIVVGVASFFIVVGVASGFIARL